MRPSRLPAHTFQRKTVAERKSKGLGRALTLTPPADSNRLFSCGPPGLHRHDIMKHTAPAAPAGDVDGHDVATANPLPGGADTTWRNCAMGGFLDWPCELRGYALTIAALPYPAAVFWDRKLTIFHNKAWADIGGMRAQGQHYQPSLSAETREVIESVRERGVPKEIHNHDILRDVSSDLKQSSTAVVSPLLGRDNAVLVQLLPRPMSYRSLEMGSGEHGSGTVVNRSGRHTADGEIQQLENTPLDEHPFFRRFAELLPSGLAILDRDARAIFVNQHFYDLTTMLDNDEQAFTSWPQSIHPDDYERVMAAYKEAFAGGRELRTEFRARGEPHPWRLLLLTPLDNDNLQHVSLKEGGGFICSIVDISSEKSAEIAERKAAQEARDRKVQQERFIDMISHEIRNPLSAVLHCAEDIGDAVRDKTSETIDTEIIQEAVETIALCVHHQKNIVDDVLSFSKLDASLLSLRPKLSNPSHQLAQTLKMFQPELRKQRMQFSFRIDDTYTESNVRSVMADMPRIGQVLINLLTNAIKFSARAEGSKSILCSVGASIEKPDSYPPDVVFFRSESVASRMDATNGQAWGSGDALYILVAVKDTGIGISAEGQKKLFQRFRQATPKTEEVYGGSGLGLNISRKICHLHGGEIGVSSKEGEGSTFGFFFKVKRCDMDAEAFDGHEGKEHLREQIKKLGIASPSDHESPEPFEWKPKPSRQQVEEASNDTTDGNEVGRAEMESESEMRREEHDTDALVVRPKLARAEKSGASPREAVTAGSDEARTEEQEEGLDAKATDSRISVLLVEDNIINQKIVHRKLEAKGERVLNLSSIFWTNPPQDLL